MSILIWLVRFPLPVALPSYLLALTGLLDGHKPYPSPASWLKSVPGILPCHITTDRGSKFSSSLWQSMADMLDVEHHLTSSFHPLVNGLVEQLHQTLKAALCVSLLHGPMSCMLWVLLRLSTTPMLDLHFSPVDIMLHHCRVSYVNH